MDEWKYPGARWWKFDFHTHTPASYDFKQDTEGVTSESWLKAFMEKGIDCVAVTDHNSGDWIDRLKQELARLEENQPIWYHPLYLFPGVEISVSGGVHLLAIFERDVNQSVIDQLLDAVDYQGTKGKSNGVTSRSLTEVVDEIAKQGGIAIPAHADKKRGVLSELQGETLRQVLKNDNIYAMELCDSNYLKPQLYTGEKVKWTEVKGSDTHNFSDNIFGTFTWIKMDEPSIDGLKLALQDGDVSVNRNMNDTPNDLPEYFIKSLEVSKAKYIGRSEPLNCQFSPFLNAIIGGPGSGKSTLLELMRLVLRRDKDIPITLEKENRKYFSVEENDSLLIEDSKISLIYSRNGVSYRLNWSAKADCPSLEQKRNGTWESCDGEIRSLFPVRIYSQKQIFELAKEPSALIEIIDDAPEVDAAKLKTLNRNLVNRYKQIEGKRRELNDKIAEESRLCWESNDIARQIEQIEKSGHKEVLQNYRQRQQQLNELDSLEGKWEDMNRRILQTQDDITPVGFNVQHFSEHTDILSALEQTDKEWQAVQDKFSELVEEASSVSAKWQTEKNMADWMQALKADMAQYEQLHSELERQGIDPDRYPMLLTQQKRVQQELDLISEHQSRLQALEVEKQEVFAKIKENRKTLSENRQKFLTRVLQGNRAVSIEVEPFGDNWNSIEKEIRDTLGCPDRFAPDIEDLKKIYQNSGDKKVEKLKEAIEGIRNGEKTAKHKSFATRLQSLSPESMIDFILWFPEDNLKITFGPNRQSIKRGSPGEKAAALLAFILSYGNVPLLLDQPEDDLDNKLIYSLIVRQLRKTKSKRQIIVVTHNANIVVNGDAEMVLPLDVAGGETHIQHAANIQGKEIQAAICDILEGGREAFDKRYKRIHLKP